MKRIYKMILVASCIAGVSFFFLGCASGNNANVRGEFVRVSGGHFIVDGKPYYFTGTNFWYGPILASVGEGGNRKRLARELDTLKSIGITNLRVLAGADGPRGMPTVIRPTLQVKPGVYNDTLLDGLDYFMKEISERGMRAVIYLNNAWEWSGGFGDYLHWSGKPLAPIPEFDGYKAYMDFVSQFVLCDSAQALFLRHVRNIITRTNRYTGIKYTDDPAIFSWQICNEPRSFTQKGKPALAEWLSETAAYIKHLDGNHMVSTGNEGLAGCEGDMALCEKINSDKNIDYMTFHLWPYNWGWVSKDSIKEGAEIAITKAMKYINEHLAVCCRADKPGVLEEFGYPRDGFEFSIGSQVSARDSFYKAVFDYIESNKKDGGYFAGCNFWAWGGFAKPSDKHTYWMLGDDYCGDPPQEQQGLNSVFISDSSTIRIIKKASEILSN
ncbi:MAG: cellulase family glycosylhydrolase [Bacteroidales bacterium]|nr:cellulase family glycosylhydrolase [Bacteroidales bacterium]